MVFFALSSSYGQGSAAANRRDGVPDVTLHASCPAQIMAAIQWISGRWSRIYDRILPQRDTSGFESLKYDSIRYGFDTVAKAAIMCMNSTRGDIYILEALAD